MNKIRKNIIATALAILCLSALCALPARADEAVENIFQHVNELNPDLVDYSAAINVNIKAKWLFVPYSPKLAGHYYHKKPDKNKLVLEEAPSFIKNQPNAFGFSLPDLKRVTSKVARVTTLNGQKCYEIIAIPKYESSIVSQQFWVNCENYTVPRQVTNYEDDGKLTVNATYTVTGNYWVFDKMHAEFSFPKVKVQASADASYSNYKFNQGLTDSFFDTKKK